MANPTSALLPRHGPDRLDALSALEQALVADAAATLTDMTAEGWRVADAIDSYRWWLHRLIDAAVDEGVCHWIAQQGKA